jgi:hypothetical protein
MYYTYIHTYICICISVCNRDGNVYAQFARNEQIARDEEEVRRYKELLHHREQAREKEEAVRKAKLAAMEKVAQVCSSPLSPLLALSLTLSLTVSRSRSLSFPPPSPASLSLSLPSSLPRCIHVFTSFPLPFSLAHANALCIHPYHLYTMNVYLFRRGTTRRWERRRKMPSEQHWFKNSARRKLTARMRNERQNAPRT